jgi:hypothetical protein
MATSVPLAVGTEESLITYLNAQFTTKTLQWESVGDIYTFFLKWATETVFGRCRYWTY